MAETIDKRNDKDANTENDDNDKDMCTYCSDRTEFARNVRIMAGHA